MNLTLHLHPEALGPGLYIVATPIGNLRDISIRAIATLMSVDLIACEDTRQSAKLLRHYGINVETTSYHDHNAAKKRPELLKALQGGKRVALISDAGTPLVSDPGYKLVREACGLSIPVTALPGASSLLTALCLSGLPTDRFLFLGFPPAGADALSDFLEPYARVPASLILFESPKRLKGTLDMLKDILGEREAAVARELTKLYEEVRRDTLSTLAAHYAHAPEPKGEIVLVIAPPVAEAATQEQLDAALRHALSRLTVKEAVAEVAASLGLPRNAVYARALKLKHA